MFPRHITLFDFCQAGKISKRIPKIRISVPLKEQSPKNPKNESDRKRVSRAVYKRGT